MTAHGEREGGAATPRGGVLRAPGAVLLVSCYELGHAPLGVAWPLAFLRRAGFAPAGLDLAVEPLDPERVARARFVGIATPMHTALRLGVRAAERVRAANPGVHLCLYGLYAALNADHLLAHVADSVIGGEYEGPLVEWVRVLDAGGGATAVAGVQRRGEPRGPDALGRARGPLARLAFPVPERPPDPPADRYVQLLRDGARTPAAYVEATRGCAHLCRHCPIPPVYGGRFHVVPADVVLEDARRQIRAGAGHVTFGDPDFFNGPGHVLPVVRALHREHPAVTFDITTKIEHILKHRAAFPELAALGCLFVVSAVESLSDVVLAHLAKGHTRADVAEALGIVRGAGIALRPSLLPFTPWSTRADYRDLLDWIQTEGLEDAVDPVQLSIRLLVPPGSLLLEHEGLRPFLRGADPANFVVRWEHPDPRMDALHAAVARLVADAARAGEDPAVTFDRIRREAEVRGVQGPGAKVQGRTVTVSSDAGPGTLDPGPFRRRIPRLTEPWFC